MQPEYNLSRMHIGIISDTHDRTEATLTAVDALLSNGAEMLIHCGDWTRPGTLTALIAVADTAAVPLRGVLGNNDQQLYDVLRLTESSGADVTVHPGVLQLSIDSVQLAVCHGHERPLLHRLLEDSAVDIVLYGHSHTPYIARENGKLVVNPGSTAFSIPRRRNWRPSVALVDTTTREARLLNGPFS